MGKRLGRSLGLAILLAVVVVGSACNKNKTTDAVSEGGEGGGPPRMGGPFGMGGGPGGRRGPIGQAMNKLFKGQQSLNETIGSELKSESPNWEMIQPQTKEFADIARSLSQYEPPKGSKESWTKLTTTFTEHATALDRGAQAKNKNEAMTAYKTISESCKSCHDEHRGGGPGGMRGGPGGFRGKGGPPGGPPGQPQ